MPYDSERSLFPGVLLVVLALVALWPPLDTTRIAYVLGLAFAVDAAFGANGLLYPLLYRWLLPFRALRVPARSSMIIGLTLSVLAGFGTHRLLSRIRSRSVAAVTTAVLCAVILFEARPALVLRPLPPVNPVYAWLKARPASVVLELPDWYPVCDRYLYFSTFHWQPMVNGCTAAIPNSYIVLHNALKSFPDSGSIALLRERSVTYVIVHEDLYGTADYHRMLERMELTGRFRLVQRATDSGSEVSIYYLGNVGLASVRAPL